MSEVNDREIKADTTTQDFLWNVVCVCERERHRGTHALQFKKKHAHCQNIVVRNGSSNYN